MAQPSRFCLGRVVKFGSMTADLLARVIFDPPTISARGARYTFISAQDVRTDDGRQATYAMLAKYRPDGEVAVVDPSRHALKQASVQDLLRASSAFVYIPSLSGIAYRHIAGSLPHEIFERMFAELVAGSGHVLLGTAEINPISDIRTFVSKLARMDAVTEISATVQPPNPLFGPLWESLFGYLKARGLDKLSVSEHSDAGIQTSLPEIAASMDRDSVVSSRSLALMTAQIGAGGDAAVLMAADGYGKATVRGRQNGEWVTYSSANDQRTFVLDGDPSPERLANEAVSQLLRVNDESGLAH